MKVWHYALGTALGMAPALLAWTVFGEQIARVLEQPSRMSAWLMVAALLALVALTYGVRRWFRSLASR